MHDWDMPKTLDHALDVIRGLVSAEVSCRERNYQLENYRAVFRMALERIALMDDPAAMRKFARETAALEYQEIGDRLNGLSK